MKGKIGAIVCVGVVGGLAMGLWSAGPGVVAAIRGRWEAGREWDAGRATIYAYGLMRNTNVDEETGLPVKAIAGCVVDDEILARADGHNAVIRKDIARSGPPAYSWLVREPGVCGIRAMWERRAGAGEVVHTVDGRGVVMIRPGVEIGECSGFQEKEMAFRLDGKEVDRLSLPGNQEMEAMGAEKEQGVVYVRWKKDSGAWGYGAADLAGAKWLRVE